MGYIGSVLRIPAHGFFIAAAAIFYATTMMQPGADQRAAEIRVAMDAEAPAAIPLEAYQRPSMSFAEANIVAQVVTERTAALENTGAVFGTGNEVMVVLADQSASAETTGFRGFILMSAEEHRAFNAWLADHKIADGALGPIAAFNGTIERDSADAAFVNAALAEQGAFVTSGAIYVAPYWHGRGLGLMAEQASNNAHIANGRGVAAILALLGLAKLLVGFEVLHFARRANAISYDLEDDLEVEPLAKAA
ncbi:MAG: hypothetical protein QNJ35_16805 [Paracoccaceae bacterium]|nr:hypothetical protein [Paracoccaceae bacterium]